MGLYLEINCWKKIHFLFHINITTALNWYVLSRSDVLGIGNRNIVLYRIELYTTLICSISQTHLASIFSSPELKAQVSFSDRLLSVVCRSVCLSICPSVCLSVCLLNIYIFDFFFRTAGPILTRLGTKHPWAKGIQNCTHEGQPPSPRGDNSERVKIHWKLLKIFFFRTSCLLANFNQTWYKSSL
jgi:hypothetical protein